MSNKKNQEKKRKKNKINDNIIINTNKNPLTIKSNNQKNKPKPVDIILYNAKIPVETKKQKRFFKRFNIYMFIYTILLFVAIIKKSLEYGRVVIQISSINFNFFYNLIFNGVVVYLLISTIFYLCLGKIFKKNSPIRELVLFILTLLITNIISVNIDIESISNWQIIVDIIIRSLILVGYLYIYSHFFKEHINKK